jgi:hypothetical protein
MSQFMPKGKSPNLLKKWVIHSYIANNIQYQPVIQLFPMPDGGWTFKALPLDINPHRHIFRQKLQIEKKGET